MLFTQQDATVNGLDGAKNTKTLSANLLGCRS